MERIRYAGFAAMVWFMAFTTIGLGQETTPRVDFTDVTNLMMWSALVATAVPWVAAIINRSTAHSFVKWAVFAGTCVVAAIGTTFFEGNFRLDGENFIRSLLIVVTLAGIYYKLWQPAVKEVERTTG